MQMKGFGEKEISLRLLSACCVVVTEYRNGAYGAGDARFPEKVAEFDFEQSWAMAEQNV